MLFVADSHGRAERTVEILQEYEIVAVPVERAEDAHAASVLVAVGLAVARLPARRRGAAGLRRDRRLRRGAPRRPRSAAICAKTFLSDLRDLKVGDLVVHVDHGIGEFVGLKQLGVRGSRRQRRSSWSSATTATTSCSSRSSGSI